ncbi:hypothetical protein FQN60_016852, partial [Etheostoma spectabile]
QSSDGPRRLTQQEEEELKSERSSVSHLPPRNHFSHIWGRSASASDGTWTGPEDGLSDALRDRRRIHGLTAILERQTGPAPGGALPVPLTAQLQPPPPPAGQHGARRGPAAAPGAGRERG